MLFSADETTDVGSDTATPVSDDYGLRNSEFTGTVLRSSTTMRPQRTRIT